MRTAAVFTSTRAEYGLLRWPLDAIRKHPDLELALLVSGTHLEPAYGNTVEDIEADGFDIAARIPMELTSDSPGGIARSMGLAAVGCVEALQRIRPAWLVLLGDRYETLAAAQAAMLYRTPIAHIHGGEITEGVIDEAIRHAITKMSHLHLTSAQLHSRRIRQMGEDPANVITVGAPGLDAIDRIELMARAALEDSLGFAFGRPTILITYHPVTLDECDPAEAVDALIAACETLGNDARFIVTGHNADTDAHRIGERFAGWHRERPDSVLLVDSLGQPRYLSALAHVDAVLGNSSSGLIEAPAFATPTVNVGPRQAGRLRGPSVIDCEEDRRSIADALATALDPSFRESLEGTGSPYGDGRASGRIAEALATRPVDGVLFKRFVDLAIPDLVA